MYITQQNLQSIMNCYINSFVIYTQRRQKFLVNPLCTVTQFEQATVSYKHPACACAVYGNCRASMM
jgi:hypothetical protein